MTVSPRPQDSGSASNKSRRERRAVSTVVDVSFAMILLSASIVTLAVFLDDQGETEVDVEAADQAVGTVSSVTASVEYSMEPAIAQDQWPSDRQYSSDAYTQSAHGTITRLMTAAAVANVRLSESDGETRLSNAGVNFERSIDGALRGQLVGGNNQTQIVAIWRPYDEATIVGRATAGANPPADADISSATFSVPSGLETVEKDAVRAGFAENGFEDAAEPIARSVVRGLFPPAETQVALEGDGFKHDLVVYRYSRARELLNANRNVEDAGVTVEYGDAIMSQRPQATEANEQLVDGLAALIAADLERVHGEDATAEEVVQSVSVQQVTIVVRTW